MGTSGDLVLGASRGTHVLVMLGVLFIPLHVSSKKMSCRCCVFPEDREENARRSDHHIWDSLSLGSKLTV